MSSQQRLLSQCYLTIGGAPATGALMDDLELVTIESSLHLPDVATVTVHDSRLRWVDSDMFAIGAALQITLRGGTGEATIFDGEIVELEPEFGVGTQRLVVRAFDRLHRLARIRHVRAFQQLSDGDLMRRLADEARLEAVIGPASYVHPYLIQPNSTNLALLQERAALLGYLLYVDGETLHCEPPDTSQPPLPLTWGENLFAFRPRLSSVGQVQRVVARGWDPERKQAVVGEAVEGRGAPRTGLEPKGGGALTQQAFQLPEAELLLSQRPLRTQALASQIAQAGADRVAGGLIIADGDCRGMSELVAGVQVELRAVGKRFGGTYFVTSATHTFDAAGGYRTHFTISGLTSDTLFSLLRPERASAVVGGFVIGVVADNADPDRMGRVRLRFPWLSDHLASAWARVVAPGAGKGRGLQLLPEIGDEVLVGFEQGDLNHPYVLGGLWNNVDGPVANDAVRNNQVQQRVIRSRSGHRILLEDGDSGGKILIEDAHGNALLLDTASDELRIRVDGNLSLSAGGDLALDASGKVTIVGKGVAIDGASGAVDVTGLRINLN